jgi:uncharacterized FAD-dependent dehydrogenase
MLKIDNIILNPNYNENDIKNAIFKKTKIHRQDILKTEILRLSIDARKKPNVKIVLSVGVTIKDNKENNFESLKFEPDRSLLNYSPRKCPFRPVVVGFGPAGMFCALCLARMNLKPIVLEQGKPVDERVADVNEFWQNRKLNKFSNVQFGEGGAGTFSDGKLTTNLNSPYCKKVTNEFVHFGAPAEILYSAKPHIGSDKLKSTVKNIRNEILSLGGEILFSHKFSSLIVQKDHIKTVLATDVQSGEQKSFQTDALFLALGHSARDTFELLFKSGFEIKQKPFAMGFRIEQKQHDINESQYGKNYDSHLPPADYKLVCHLKNGRSVFTFCMCPGGQVIASSSAEGEIVTNGMSNFLRDADNANSAVLVNVVPEDYHSTHPLAGIYFQSKYEKLCFNLAGKNYNAPVETVASFLGKNIESNEDSVSCENLVSPSYLPGVTMSNLEKCLPSFVTESLKLGLVEFNKKLHNFAKDENLLIGIESRSSCPLTIVRGEDLQSNIKGVFPIGEGAGYAGGIMSSAVDGIKSAEFFYSTLN